jgi:hypothetical protein
MSRQAGTGRIVADRYELVAAVGAGPVGVVWRAHDRRTDRQVAVREVELPDVLDDAEQAALAEKVLREARTAARLDHPGAVAVLDVVSEEGRPFVVTELVTAPTLAEWVAGHGPLTPAQAGVVGLELLDALAAAHRIHLFHRDVRPSNVLLTASGAARLVDFGVSSIVDDPKVTASGGVPDPSYLAPEQAGSAGASSHSDLWSLGATLYFAVEGAPPFDGADPASTIASIVDDRPRPAWRAGPLKRVLDALLVKDPTARPDDEATRRLLLEATHVAAGSVPAAPPPTPAAATFEGSAPVEPEEAGPDKVEEAAPDKVEEPAPVKAGEPFLAIPEEPAPAAAGEPAAVEPAEPVPAGTPPPPVPAETARPAPDPWTFHWPDENDPPTAAPQAAHPAVAPRTEGRRRRVPRLAWLAVLALLVAVTMVVLLTRDDSAGTSRPRVESAAPSTTTPWVRYTDAATGFDVRYPTDWGVQRVGTQTFFVDPATRGYFSVDHVPRPSVPPLDAWVDQERNFAATHPDYTRLQLVSTSFLGVPAATWEYTYSEAGTSLHTYSLDFTIGRFGYILSFRAPTTDWSRMQPTLETFKSFFSAPA